MNEQMRVMMKEEGGSLGKWRKEKKGFEIPPGIDMTKPFKKAL